MSHWSEPQLNLTCSVYFLCFFWSPCFWKTISSENSTINWFVILSGYMRHTIWSSRLIVDTVVVFFFFACSTFYDCIWNLKFGLWLLLAFFPAKVVFWVVIECFDRRSHYCDSNEKKYTWFISALTNKQSKVLLCFKVGVFFWKVSFQVVLIFLPITSWFPFCLIF